MQIIVAYDIANPKRLQRVAKIMKDYGLRVQKSIFEVDIDEHMFAVMKLRIEAEIDIEQDGVKYFPLCSRCCNTAITFGKAIKTVKNEKYIVI
ncbi:MAG: CRISPR-associated endonuclease Cas2 [Trichlorobacter sp.]|nr:CRISPR-associated endonuclease Cas2 [Trichlorobacter sp.]